MMHDRIPWQEHVLRKTAPQMRRALSGGIAIADGVGVGAPIGVLAMPVLPGVAPLAFAARDIVFDEDEIALLEALAAGEFTASFGDGADIFVAHDHRRLGRRVL